MEQLLPGKQSSMDKELETDPFSVHAGDGNLFSARRHLSASQSALFKYYNRRRHRYYSGRRWFPVPFFLSRKITAQDPQDREKSLQL